MKKDCRKKMKKFIFVLLLIFAANLAYSSPTNFITLNKAIQIALTNNIEIKLLSQNIKKAQLKRKSSSRWFQDNPEISAGITKDKQSSVGLASVSLPIEIRGQQYYRRRISEQNLSKQRLLLKKSKLQIIKKIKQNFIALYITKKKLKIIKDISRIESNLLNFLQKKMENGEISNIDYSAFKIEAFLQQNKIIGLRQKLISLNKNIEFLLNYKFKKNDVLVYSLPQYPKGLTLPILIKNTMNNNPDFLISKIDYKISEYKTSLIKSKSFLQRITPYASYTFDNSIEAGLSLPLPFFNLKIPEIKSSKIETMSAKLKESEIKKRIIQNLNMKYTNFKNLSKQKNYVSKKIIPLTKQTLNDVQLYYQRGEINLQTFEKYSEKWLDVKIEYLNLLKKYYDNLAEIEFITGGNLTGYPRSPDSLLNTK